MSTVEPFYSRAWLHCKLLFSCKVVSNLFVTPWTAACQASLSFTISQVRDAIQPSCPLLSPSPPGFNLSQHQGLFNELALCNRWPNYWSFSFSTTVSNEYSGVIYFRINWFNFLSVQGTLRSILEHQSSKVSILHCSAFFIS